MGRKLDMRDYFENDEELRRMVVRRKICYDSEPLYVADRKGVMIRIGFWLTLYGSLPEVFDDVTPDSEGYVEVERYIRKLAGALLPDSGPLRMSGPTTVDPATLCYSRDGEMRPDVTVHIPVYGWKNFGRAVDEKGKYTLQEASELLEAVGVWKKRWPG